MIEPIGNPKILELVDAIVVAGWPTAREFRDAMAMAYKAGKIDGSLETCAKLAQPKAT